MEKSYKTCGGNVRSRLFGLKRQLAEGEREYLGKGRQDDMVQIQYACEVLSHRKNYKSHDQGRKEGQVSTPIEVIKIKIH